MEIFDWSLFAERLRGRREVQGLSQGQAALYAGKKAQTYVSNLENGRNQPGAVELVARLARLYKTSADYLFGLTDDFLPPDRRALSPHVLILLNTIEAMPPDQQWQLLQMARLMNGRLDELLEDVLDTFLASRQGERIEVHGAVKVDEVLGLSEAIALGDIAAMFRMLRARGFHQEYLRQELEQVYGE